MHFRPLPFLAVLMALMLLELGTSPARAGLAFTPDAPMLMKRYGHTATLLRDGKVLVTGGRIFPSGVTNEAEIYDPTKGTWTAVAPMVTTRMGHTATLLANGKVLVTGGYTVIYPYGLPSSSIVKTVELYDPSLNVWHHVGSMAAPRESHTATLLASGKVLVVGGVDTTNAASQVSLTELFDPNTLVWSPTGSTSTVRFAHSATLLPSGKVLVAGGEISGSTVSSAEVYDPAKGTWSPTGDMIEARFFHSATLLLNGKVLVAGGKDSAVAASSTAETYDPGTGTWSLTGSLMAVRYKHQATLLPLGKVLVTGGYTGGYTGSSGVATDSAELFNPDAGTWSTAGVMGYGRIAHAATLLSDGDVLITGGTDGNVDVMASVEEYGLGDVHGSFNGLVSPEAGTASNVSTQGSFTATVQFTRDFTSKLLIDGQTLNVVGKFDENGVARFGTAQTSSLTLLRTNKPSLAVALQIGAGALGTDLKVTGTVTRLMRSAVIAVSDIDSDPSFYDGLGTTTSVPAAYLGPNNADGLFNIILPALDVTNQPSGFTTADYPQGTGYGSLKITKKGTVTFSGKLADGTGVTFASTVARHLVPGMLPGIHPTTFSTFPLFASLYGNTGFITTTVALDSTQADSDMIAAPSRLQWGRPFQTTQWYPYGWPEVIVTDLLGAMYTVTPGASVLPGVTPPAIGNPGNATLSLRQGLLAANFDRGLIVSSADAVTKLNLKDTSYTLAITRGSGAFSGTFLHTDGTKPAFQGLIYQKGAFAGGHGYFLTTSPKVRDYTGQCGTVTLTAP